MCTYKLLATVTIISLFKFCSSGTSTPDAYLEVPQIIEKYGYPVEVHYITTPDGYILTTHRIPGNNTLSKKPILLYHGILCASDNFVTSGNRSLGFVLADAGYDVWLGNARGNRQSRNHTTLNPDTDSKFWDFSWHEIGVKDLPTVIDYILKITDEPNLYYIGYSQGGTILFVLLTMQPEYNSKIRMHMHLAPGSWKNGTTIPFYSLLSSQVDLVEGVLKLVGVNEILPFNRLLMVALQNFCRLAPWICVEFFFLISGRSRGQFDLKLLPSMIGHLPDGASTRQVIHYMQLAKSGYFRQYDFGRKNVKLYGSKEPPSYNLSLITAPGFMFHSETDKIVAADDIQRLCRKMVNGCEGSFSLESYNHFDYLYGKKSPELYRKLLDLLGQY